MKKIVGIIIFIAAVGGLSLYAQPFFGGKTMKKSEVQKKWGSEKFDLEKFKNGEHETKAKMAFSIMSDKTLVGKSIDLIREKFGPPDGFYFIDIYPAYIIQEGTTSKEETWQIVFKLNEKYEVREVIVHKNCCY